MNRQKIGNILFWIGVFGAIIYLILNWIMTPIHRVNSIEDLSGSLWSPAGGPLFSLWQLMGIFIIVLPIMGVLLLSGGKGSWFWLWGFVPFIVYNIGAFWKPSQYYPPLFGVGGMIILISYLGILWLWTKIHNQYEGASKTGRHIQLLGYSFLFVTALFLCLYIGNPNLPAVANFTVSAEIVLITLSIGMLLLFVGHSVAARSVEEVTAGPQEDLKPQPSATD